MTPTAEQRLDAVEAACLELQDAVGAMHQTVQLLLLQHSAEVEEQTSPGKMRDSVWACTSCGAKLGVYNPDTDELRLRYKELAVYMVPGQGGSIKVPCRRCAELNTLEDTRTTAKVAGGAAGK